MLLLASVASALAPSFAILAIAQLAIGVGIAILLSGAVAAAAEWTPPETRSRVLAWALVGQPAAWVVGMPAIGIVAGLGWRYAWLAVPAVASATALFALRLQREAAARTAPPPVVRPAGYDRAVAGWALGELLAYAGWSEPARVLGALLLESYETSPATCGLLLGIRAAAYFRERSCASMGRSPLAPHADRARPGALGERGLLRVIRPGLGYSAVVFALAVFVAGGRTLAGSTHGLVLASGGRVAVTSIRAAATSVRQPPRVGLGGAALARGMTRSAWFSRACWRSRSSARRAPVAPRGRLPRRPSRSGLTWP
jgi:MFS family permease